jgi:hypothetical protein
MINIELVGFDAAKKAMLGANKNFPAALRDAIHRGLKHGQTQAGRIVSARYNIGANEVKSSLSVEMSGDGGTLASRAPMLRIEAFNPSVLKKGAISVAVIRGQRKRIGRAFSAKGRIYKRKGEDRYPIGPVTAIGVASMIAVPETAPQVEKAIAEFAAARLAANVQRALSGKAFA